jgi:hypothetical protein
MLSSQITDELNLVAQPVGWSRASHFFAVLSPFLSRSFVVSPPFRLPMSLDDLQSKLIERQIGQPSQLALTVQRFEDRGRRRVVLHGVNDFLDHVFALAQLSHDRVLSGC